MLQLADLIFLDIRLCPGPMGREGKPGLEGPRDISKSKSMVQGSVSSR